jgi:hypothetical protein
VGNLAVVFMAALLLAYLVGGAIRFNILHRSATTCRCWQFSFLNVMGFDQPLAAHVVTTVLLLIIGLTGMWRGLGKLESLEKYTVGLNLGMIGSLLIALTVYNLRHLLNGSWSLPELSGTVDFRDTRILLGLLIVVQGFETSRYLGDAHPAQQRVATMRTAQLITAAVYLLFIGLTTVLFRPDAGADLTAIIQMAAPVASILPALLAVAAIGSQFSAAVADHVGAGGLIMNITHGKVPGVLCATCLRVAALGLPSE